MSTEIALATADSPAPAQVHEARTARLLRRLVADAVLLRANIHQACRGHSFALNEVERIAHQMRASAAMLGSHRVSAMSEAIEHLAAGVIADAEAHGPFAESALLQQISYCIEQVAAAVDVARSKASSNHPAYQAN
jgi:HPt (histidine-containing phosphotransfer) domain-containing protein